MFYFAKGTTMSSSLQHDTSNSSTPQGLSLVVYDNFYFSVAVLKETAHPSEMIVLV